MCRLIFWVGLAFGFYKALALMTNPWRKQVNFGQALEEEKHGA